MNFANLLLKPDHDMDEQTIYSHWTNQRQQLEIPNIMLQVMTRFVMKSLNICQNILFKLCYSCLTTYGLSTTVMDTLHCNYISQKSSKPSTLSSAYRHWLSTSNGSRNSMPVLTLIVLPLSTKRAVCNVPNDFSTEKRALEQGCPTCGPRTHFT